MKRRELLKGLGLATVLAGGGFSPSTIAKRLEGTPVPLGFSVTETEVAYHLLYRVVVKKEKVHVRLRIPKATAADWTTWTAYEERQSFNVVAKRGRGVSLKDFAGEGVELEVT